MKPRQFRALVAFNAMSRREETTLFVPVDPANSDAVIHAVSSVHRLAVARAIRATD